MLKGILAISGRPGLFKLVSNTGKNLIVESLAEKKRMPAHATSKINSLEDISIFTEDGDVALVEVFKNIQEKEQGGKAIHHKSTPDDLKAYMLEVLPNYDEDRVYVSDMKKIFQWYNLLQENGLIEDLKQENTSEEESNGA